MTTAEVIIDGDTQVIRLPRGYQVSGDKVNIQRLGAGLFLEPASRRSWPPGFFEAIRSDDPTFVRPEQGELPAAHKFDEE